MGCNLPGSSVHGILQERILEWVSSSFPRRSSQLDRTCVSYVSYIGRWILYHYHHIYVDGQSQIYLVEQSFPVLFFFKQVYYVVQKNVKL